MAKGMTRISIQASDVARAPHTFSGFEGALVAEVLPLDLEEAARLYLQAWVTGPTLSIPPPSGINAAFLISSGDANEPPGTTPAAAEEFSSTLEHVGTQAIALASTHVVSYRQRYRGVPVYGAMVGVELTD